MEFETKEVQKLDLFVMLDDLLRAVKRLWILGLVLVLAGGSVFSIREKMNYSPVYEAYASFTVRVANPLYGSVSNYNAKTAEQMAMTFPSIVSSGVLKKRVMEYLDVSSLPALAASASAESTILTLKVRHKDPQQAYDVLNAVITCYPEVAEFVVGSIMLVLLDESGVPTYPINAFDLKGALVKGAAIGAVLWMGILALVILTRNTVHNEEEMRRVLNTPCLGQLPAVKVLRQVPCPLLHKSKRASGFAESVRLLRLRVEKAMEEDGKKVLLVSSAIPGEGKTTVAVNLAVSLAMKGKQVLLIDCDLRNPSVVKALSGKNHQLTDKNSLADYLRSKTAVRDMIQSAEVENLHVISGGAGIRSDHAVLLSQERMARLIQTARNQFDYVILDTPPCSMLADAGEVAELAECGLMVIRQDYASRDQIVDGAQRLGDGNLELIGCTFNMVRKSITDEHGYGYGYGYGYDYGYGKKK